MIEEFYCFNEIQLHQREFNWINYYFPKYNTSYNLSKYIIVGGYECIEKKEMIDYNLNINLFPNKKFQCLCGGSYTRDNLSHHSYLNICKNYRIKNNLPIVERNYIYCDICCGKYTISRKKQHDQESKKHLEYLKYYHCDDMDNLIDQFNKISI